MVILKSAPGTPDQEGATFALFFFMLLVLFSGLFYLAFYLPRRFGKPEWKLTSGAAFLALAILPGVLIPHNWLYLGFAASASAVVVIVSVLGAMAVPKNKDLGVLYGLLLLLALGLVLLFFRMSIG